MGGNACKCESKGSGFERVETIGAFDDEPDDKDIIVTKNRRTKPSPLILVTDPGQDLDDEMTYIMLKHLVELGMAECKGIITTLAPAFDRARLVRGTLDVLGLFGVPVGVGSDGGDVDAKHKASTFVEWARPYMPPRYSAASDSFKPGRMLLHTLYENAAKKSLVLVIIAALKDPALFLRDEEELFVDKTREVVIMGGVEAWDDTPGGQVELVPDTANNNTFDMEAARYFHKRCQELGIPLIIVTRWSAYAAKVPVSCYNQLALSGSWIGCRLRNAQRASIESLWSRAASPAGSDERHGLPDRCDRTWFLKTFCAGAQAAGRGPADTIWDLIAGFMQYDTVATLCAIPEIREQFFEPTVVTGLKGINHLVIGKSEQEHNIKSTDTLSRFLNSGFRKGLAYNHQRKTQFVLVLQPRWSSKAENFVAFVALRAVFELGIFDCAGILVQPVPGMSAVAGEVNILDFAKETENTLGILGMSHVPVLIDDPSGAGAEHLKTLYGKVTPAGVFLVVTGSLDVVADFAEGHPKLFLQKTQRVILVSGAMKGSDSDDNGHATGEEVLVPDPAASNNQLDMIAAKRFFKITQRLLVPLVVVTRHFASAVQIPRSFFDILGELRYGGVVGKQLYDVQRNSTEQLWKAIRTRPRDSMESLNLFSPRPDLPNRCDRAWYIENFCAGNEPASDSIDDVWKSTLSFNVYNLQALLMALPPVYNRFVRGSSVTVRSVKHSIAGDSSDNPGIVDASELRKLILQCIVVGTRLNSSAFDLETPPPVKLDEGQSSSSWSYDSSKEALAWLLPREIRKDYSAAYARKMPATDFWTFKY